MFYGKVIGTVVSTNKNRKLRGYKLLVVQKINHVFEEEEEAIVAIDYVQAGIGEYIYYTKSKDATFPLKDRNTPVDACIVGIIDSIYLINGEKK